LPSTYGPVILVPGFMGSQLVFLTGPNVGDTLWAETLYIMQPDSSLRMMLAPDGKSPYPDYGTRLGALGTVPPYYTDWETTLRSQQVKEDFGPVVQLSWDWRRSFMDSVDQLAGLIVTVARDQPVNIVAHSAGGLLARLAYAKLVDDGQTSLVRRIITLGTPHKGSFDAVSSLCGFESFYDRFLWKALIGWHRALPTTPYGVVRDTGTFWSIIGGSWPGLYQLLPAPDETTEEGRKLANLLYTATNYPTSPYLFQAWFDRARLTVWPRLNDAKYAVPSDKLKCLAGTGIPTLKALGPVTIPFTLNTLAQGQRGDGDGVVTVLSQYVAGAGQISAPSGHREEPQGFALNRMIANAIVAADTMTIAPKGFSTPVVSNQTPPMPFPKSSAEQPAATIEFGSYPPSRNIVGDP
jgi:pimeloyl-ACP methyl ester carboxylesterase